MKYAEAIKHGRDGIDIVLKPIGGLRLDNEQSAVGFEKLAYFLERALRGCKIVDAVACRDQVERGGGVEIVGRTGSKGDALGNAGHRGRRRGLADGLSIRIETNNSRLRKILGDGNADTTGAATDVEYAGARLQTTTYLRQFLEPITGEPMLILPAIDQVEPDNTVHTIFLEANAATF